MQWDRLVHDLETGVPHSRRFDAATGATIIRQGESDPPVYVLVSGSIQVVKRIEDGKSMVLKSSEAPAIIGDVEAFLGRPALCSVVVRRPVKGFAVAPALLRKQIRESPDWAELILTQLADKLTASDSRLVPRVLRPIRSAVAQAILDRLPTQEATSGSDHTLPWHRISKTEIADEIGATYRSVSRAFEEFSTQGMIEYRRGRVRVIHRSRLARILEEA